jgi:alkanesulfonate monooxygenase
MPVEFIGYTATQEASETHLPTGPVIDKNYVRTVVQAHEKSGFDRVLVAYSSGSPDGFQVAAYALQQVERVGVLLAHRPGFTAPTLAARQLATLDQFSDGRLAVHIISGGDDTEQQRDGDFLTHDERYARTDEYLEIVNRIWTSNTPIDHDGRFYKLKGGFSSVKPLQKPHLPVYFGGSSAAAVDVAGRRADVFALWGEPLEQVRGEIARLRTSAARYGRADHLRFSLSLRPILAPTEAQAWERAERILARAKELQAVNPFYQKRTEPPPNVGSLRLLETAAKGKVVDKRLWTEVAQLTGAKGNSTSLVGTPEQVAESLFDYYDLGITTFLIRGFDPLDDAIDYGRELIPLVRQEIARRDAAPRAAVG